MDYLRSLLKDWVSKMSIDAGAILRAVGKFTTERASDIYNVYHLVMTGESNVAESQVVLDCRDYVLQIMNNVTALYTPQTVMDEVEVWSLNFTSMEWESIGSLAGAWQGSGVDTSELPAQVAPLMRANTTNAKSKGRKYMPPPNEAAATDGVLTVGALAALGNAAVDWIDTYASGARSYTPGVWSPTDIVFYAFNGVAIVSQLFGTQRRRKEGVGS